MLKPQNTISYEPTPKGTHCAILYSIVDLGTQEVEWKGEKKLVPKVRFTWELPNETKEFDGIIKPLSIGQSFTLSMGSKSNLRPVVEGMIGATLRDDEAANFDIQKFKDLLGSVCMVNVIHVERNGKTYANVDAVVPLAKGMAIPKQFNENVIFELGTSDEDTFSKLPKFIQEMIGKSKESTEGDSPASKGSDGERIDPKDIPF